MKEIKLTQGKVALVDDADYNFLSQWKWHAHKNKEGNTWYANRRNGNKYIKMHRLIMGVTDPDIKIDHRDRNGLHNYRSNLRIATPAQNCTNRRPKINGTSKYLGVHWHKRMNRWQAKIRVNKTPIYLGTYTSESEAAMAYNKAAIKYHGEFSNLNQLS